MANYKGVGFDQATGRVRTGTSSDAIQFAAQVDAQDGLAVTGNASATTLDVSGDASVGGDLTVTGDIVSRGTVDLLVEDNFIDLNAGNDSTTALSSGFTFSLNRAASFNTGTVTTFVAGVAGVSNPTFTNTNAGTSTALAVGDIVFITDATQASNDGLYVVEARSGASFPQTITIQGIGTVAVNGSTPFAQNQFTADTGNTAKVYKVDLKVVAIADGTVSFKDSGGGAIAKGTVVEAFATSASLSDFTANGAYSELGAASSLQVAYNTGNTITTAGTNPVALTLGADNAGFSVQGNAAGDGVVSIGGTTTVDSFIVGASGAASDIQSVGQNLTVRTTTSGVLTVSSAGTAIVDSDDDLTIKMDANDNSAKSILIQANNASGGGSAQAVIALDADNSVQTQIAGARVVEVVAASVSANQNIILDKASGGEQTITKDGSSAAGDDLKIAVTGNQNSSLILESAGSGTDALTVQTVTNNGSILIDSAGGLDMNSDDVMTIKMDANANSAKNILIQANNTNVGGSATAVVQIDGDDGVQLQFGGATKVNMENATTIFNNTIQADTTAGLKFGGSGSQITDFIDDDTFTTGVDPNSVASSESIKAYVDSNGIANFLKIAEMTCAETIAIGDVVAIKVDGGNEGRVIKADADAISTCNVIGFAISAGNNGDDIQVAQAGGLGGFSSLTAGDKLFASTTAGGITNSISGFTAGDVVFQLGFATSTTTIIIQPMFVMEIG